MTPEEKTQVLGTIEKLANKDFWSYRRVKPYAPLIKDQQSYGLKFNADYPCVVWHWEGEKIVVTGFIQKEI